MTRIGIPPEVAGMLAACEEAYEQATLEGYADTPAVTGALTALRSAWKALHVRRGNLMTAKGFFSVEFAMMRDDRACRATREACINLHTALVQAAAEHRLYNRCVTLTTGERRQEVAGGHTRVA